MKIFVVVTSKSCTVHAQSACSRILGTFDLLLTYFENILKKKDYLLKKFLALVLPCIFATKKYSIVCINNLTYKIHYIYKSCVFSKYFPTEGLCHHHSPHRRHRIHPATSGASAKTNHLPLKWLRHPFTFNAPDAAHRAWWEAILAIIV